MTMLLSNGYIVRSMVRAEFSMRGDTVLSPETLPVRLSVGSRYRRSCSGWQLFPLLLLLLLLRYGHSVVFVVDGEKRGHRRYQISCSPFLILYSLPSRLMSFSFVVPLFHFLLLATCDQKKPPWREKMMIRKLKERDKRKEERREKEEGNRYPRPEMERKT